MRVEILYVENGVLRPLRLLEATVVVIRNRENTPISVAAEFGTPAVTALAHAKDADFNTVLRNLGIQETTICDELVLPKPTPGARLVAGPGIKI